MIEAFDSLHATSLRLVGRRVPSSNAATKDNSNCDLPWDEVDAVPSIDTTNSVPNKVTSIDQNNSNSTIHNMAESQTVLTDLSGPDESRWRAHGAAKRKELLEEDRIKGGRTFKLSYDTSVQRYFSVAHWALEQFHQLYQSGTDLEETYVMGYRIVSFLTECLPKHPGLRRAPDVRQRAREELQLLRDCLEDVALQIDEETCNRFVEEFDPLRVVGGEDDDDDSVSEDGITEEAPAATSPSSVARTPSKSSIVKKKRMVRFEGWDEGPADEGLEGRKSAESPSAETVGTTGTGSLEPHETSYFSSSSEETDDHSNAVRTSITLGMLQDVDLDNLEHATYPYRVSGMEYDDDENAAFPSPRRLYSRRHVSLDFLHKIANEEVLYETDSEAADSWAQTPEESSCHHQTPSSSGLTPTCDPARIAFRDLMNRIPRKIDFHSPSDHGNNRTDQREELDEMEMQRHTENEKEVENEIRRYLESEDHDDPDLFVESCYEKLKGKTAFSSSSVGDDPSAEMPGATMASFSSVSSGTSQSAFRPYTKMPGKKTDEGMNTSRKKLFGNQSQDAFLEDDAWISFDSSESRVPINFFASRR